MTADEADGTAAAQTLPIEVRAQIGTQVAKLAAEFEGIFAKETIQRFVDESLARWPEATVTSHLPLLAYRFARERLRAYGIAEGKIVSETPEVLFVCVHNAGRSQMAAGLLAKHAKGRVAVRSAGSAPAESINPAVAEAMAEVGVDLSEEYPKPLTDEFVRASDVVITMGCGDACPVFPGKTYLDWDLEDPAGLRVEDVRPIRDEIERRVLALLDDLVG